MIKTLLFSYCLSRFAVKQKIKINLRGKEEKILNLYKLQQLNKGKRKQEKVHER